MHTYAPLGDVLAATSKHQLAGIVAIVLGVVLVGLGAMRVIGRAASAAVVPLVGAAVVIFGILVFTRVV